MALTDKVVLSIGRDSNDTEKPSENFSEAAKDFYAMGDGPVRTQYYWDSASTILDHPFAPPLNNAVMAVDFLTAHQHPLTRRWSIIPCRMTVEKDPTNKENEDALNPKTVSVYQEIETGLSFIEMLKALNAYEQARDQQSVTVEMPQNYEAPEHYRAFGQKEGLVFDRETGLPSPLSVHCLPIIPGDYDMVDLGLAQKAAKARQKHKDGRGAIKDQVAQYAGQYNANGDVAGLEQLIRSVRETASFARYKEAYDNVFNALAVLVSNRSFVEIIRGWDYNKEINLTKKFKKAFADLKSARSQIRLPQSSTLAQEELDMQVQAAQLAFELVSAQIRYCDLKDAQPNSSNAEAEFRKSIEALESKASSMFIAPIVGALKSAAIIHRRYDIETPAFFCDIKSAIGDSLRRMESDRRDMEQSYRLGHRKQGL
jgi:hypothetical protein